MSKQIDAGFLIDLPQGGNGILRSSINEELQIGQCLLVKILSCSHGKVELEIADNREESDAG